MLNARGHIAGCSLACTLVAVWVLSISSHPASAAGGGTGRAATVAAPKDSERVPQRTGIHQSRQNRVLTQEHIRAAIHRFVQRQLPGPHRIEVDVLYPRDAVTMPAGASRPTVKAIGPRDRLGRLSFALVFRVGGRETERLKVLADVIAYVPAVTPVRLIRPHETITLRPRVSPRRSALPAERRRPAG